MKNNRAEGIWTQSQKILRYLARVLNDIEQIEKLSAGILKRRLVMPQTRKDVKAIQDLTSKHTSIRAATTKELIL